MDHEPKETSFRADTEPEDSLESSQETLTALERLDLFEPPVVGNDIETAVSMDPAVLDTFRADARHLNAEQLRAEIQSRTPDVSKLRAGGGFMSPAEVQLAILAQEAVFREKIEGAAERHLEVREIASGVFRLADYRFNIPATYAVVTPEGIAVIDPGIPTTLEVTEPFHDAREEFLRLIERRYGRRADTVLLIHADPDHMMAIPEMAGRNAVVYTRPQNFEDLADPEGFFVRKEQALIQTTGKGFGLDEAQRVPGYAVLSANALGQKEYYPKPLGTPGEGIRYADFPDDTIELAEGNMEIISLPGHVPGEVGFWFLETRTLVTGDLIPNDHPERAEYPDLFLPGANAYDARGSLQAILDLKPNRLSPGHGPMIEGADAVQARLTHMIRNLDDIIRRTMDAHHDHPKWSVNEIAKHVYAAPDIPHTRFMGPREQRTMVTSILNDASSRREVE